MIDGVYHLFMGQPKLKEELVESELSDEALALIDHIGQIIAEEYVKLLKSETQEKESQEES
jgi:hypothetical protein